MLWRLVQRGSIICAAGGGSNKGRSIGTRRSESASQANRRGKKRGAGGGREGSYLFVFRHVGAHGLDAVTALDDVGLQRDGARAAVQLQKEAAGVAEDGAGLVASP